MGGYGSGYRRGARTTADSQLRLDIGWMIRQCPIREGSWDRSIAWLRRDEQIGSCHYYLDRDFEKPRSLRISCTANGNPFSQELDLVYLRMPKGGFKTYARCPYCYRRKLKLYFSGRGKVCCRECASFTYESSQESKKPSGFLKLFVRLLEEERRWERKETSHATRIIRCREWRKRKNPATTTKRPPNQGDASQPCFDHRVRP